MSSHAPGTPARTYPPRPEAVYFYGTCLVDTFVPEAGLDAMGGWMDQIGVVPSTFTMEMKTASEPNSRNELALKTSTVRWPVQPADRKCGQR